MSSIWAFLKRKGNREILAWLGGGTVVVVGALWTAIVFFSDHKKPDPNGGGATVTGAACGVTTSGNATGNSVSCTPPPAPTKP